MASGQLGVAAPRAPAHGDASDHQVGIAGRADSPRGGRECAGDLGGELAQRHRRGERRRFVPCRAVDAVGACTSTSKAGSS